MRALVTGAAGFIGSHLCEALLADGHEVVGLDSFVDYYARYRKEQNLSGARQQQRFSFHERDLRTDPLTDLLEGCDAVVNQAAMPGLPRSWSHFDDYVSCNLSAVQRLVEACRTASVPRLIHISTSSVYGREAIGVEDQPLRPVSPYGVTKLAGEQLVLAYAATFGVPATVLRYFSVYGPRQRPDMAYHIFIDALLRGSPITVFGDGSQSRATTYVSDCVQGTIQALTGAAVGEVYNIGGGTPITVLEAIGIIAEAVGTRPRIVHTAERPGDQQRTAPDISKARGAFGYAPSVEPREGLTRQVEWQRGQLASPSASKETT